MNIKKLKSGKTFRFIAEVISFIAGAAIFSVGVSVFITPAEISVGGFTGISLVINHLTAFPVGVLIIALNIPMFIICAFVFGFKFIIKSVAGVILSSVFIDFFAFLPPFENVSRELSALFGGVLQGIGLGLVYRNGFTTGGTDLVIWLLKLKFPNLTSGFLIFVLDSLVVSLAAFILRDIESILYSAITIFTASRIIDTILGSGDRANLAYIISEHYAEIADKIDSVLGRGTTLISGKGWYTKRKREIIMCVVDRSQLHLLRTLTGDIDPEAFLILTDAKEVVGLGFKKLEKKR